MRSLYVFFLLSCTLLTAEVLPQMQVQVRLVSFEKAGANLATLEAGSDEPFYASLTADAASGTAVRVHDQTVSIRNGQTAHTEAVRWFPYWDFDVDPEGWFTVPALGTLRNLGFTMEVAADAGEPERGGAQRVLSLNLSAEWSTLLTMHPWPVPNLRSPDAPGHLPRPVFAAWKAETGLLTWTGRTVLISVAPAPGAELAAPKAPVFRYTFMRGGLDGEKARASGAREMDVEQRRLHVLTIRLPRGEAAALLWQHAGDDAALYAELRRRMAGGRASLSGHMAVHCVAGRRAVLSSGAEFPSPNDWTDLIPQQWTSIPTGGRMEVEAETEGGGATGAGWNTALQFTEAPEMVSFNPSEKHPDLHGTVVEYVSRKYQGLIRMPSSGVLCGGAISTSPATEEEGDAGGLTDVCLFLQSPPPAVSRPGLAAQAMVQSLIFSVPAAEGPGFAARMQAAEILDAFWQRKAAQDECEIRCAAHAGVMIRDGQRGHTEEVRYVAEPESYYDAGHDRKLRVPSEWKSFPCGLILEVQGRVEENALTLDGALTWDTAPVSGFGKPGAAVPEIEARRSVQTIAWKKLKLVRGQPVIVDVRASNAREGTPEHGRWHVAVLMAK